MALHPSAARQHLHEVGMFGRRQALAQHVENAAKIEARERLRVEPEAGKCFRVNDALPDILSCRLFEMANTR